MNEDIDGLDTQVQACWKVIDAAHEELRALRELRDEALDAHLATLTVGDILNDEALLRRVLREAFHHSGASKIVHALYATGRKDLATEGIDGRDEYAADVLPALQLQLTRNQDVEELEQAIRAWADKWALGRTDLRISILERTLSRWGSYHLVWPVGKVCGVLEGPYGSEILSGPLRVLLERAASEYYYLNADGTAAPDEKDDEGYRYDY